MQENELRDMASGVTSRLLDYQKSFRRFKDAVGLTPIENKHESVSGIVDKLGRMVRHVKHNGRNDPRPDFPADAAESYQGILAYLDMILEGVEIPEDALRQGIMDELMKAVKQHVKE